MEGAVAEVRAEVSALRSGCPVAAQTAANRLAKLQRTPRVVPLCAALLEEALRAGDDAAAFFAAQTLAARARLGMSDDGEVAAWPPLARQIVEVLCTTSSGSCRVSVSVLRQLCVALCRLVVWLSESWPGAVEEVLAGLSGGTDCIPLLEVLQALAEEPFSRRLLVDGSCRARFLLALRAHVPAILLSACATSAVCPGAPPLRCVTAWLRAQPGFEEWLPIVGFSCAGVGAHPALGAIVPIVPLCLRAARLELGFEAFEAAADLVEAAVPLAGDLSTPEASETIARLLGAFAETCMHLTTTCGRGQGNVQATALVAGDKSSVAEVIAVVLRSAFGAMMPLLCEEALRRALLAAGVRLLVLGGAREDQDSEGGLLDRGLGVWEALVESHRDACDSGKNIPEAAMANAFAQFLDGLPEALALPETSAPKPPPPRVRVPQLLVLWCDASDARLAGLLNMLRVATGRVLPSTGWAELELVLFIATCVAEVFAARGDAAAACELPDPLGPLFVGLPQIQLATAPPPWRVRIAATGAEFITALDPWICPERCTMEAPETSELLRFLFDLATEPVAAAAAVEALIVVLSNLALQLAAGGRGEAVEKLQQLSLGDSGLAIALRERLVRSALGPVLSCLPPEQLDSAVESLVAPLRAVARPASGDVGAPAAPADAATAARLLFHLLAAPEVKGRCEAPLAWLSIHWPWLEAALSPAPAAAAATPEPVVEAACHALTTILSRGRALSAAPTILCRATPLLVHAVLCQGSAAALSALGLLVRIFKGGEEQNTAELLASHILQISSGLLGEGVGCAAQLPSEILGAFLELLVIALGPRCKLLASRLFAADCAPTPLLIAIFAAVLPVLPNSSSPQCVCWGLLLVDRLPHWLDDRELRPQVAKLIDAVVPHVASACCLLLASSPLVADAEVACALARALCSLVRGAGPDVVRCSLVSAGETVGTPCEEVSLLSQQVSDPVQTEETLAEALREAADTWQADHIRRAFLAA